MKKKIPSFKVRVQRDITELHRGLQQALKKRLPDHRVHVSYKHADRSFELLVFRMDSMATGHPQIWYIGQQHMMSRAEYRRRRTSGKEWYFVFAPHNVPNTTTPVPEFLKR